MYCISFCIGQKLDLAALEKTVRVNCNQNLMRKKGVLAISLENNANIFFFQNGTMVSWQLKRYQCTPWIELATPHCQQPMAAKTILKDEFSYQISDKTTISPHDYFNIDCLTLEEDCDDIKLSISYGLSQSIKLNFYESRLERLISESMPMMETIKQKSFRKISKRTLQKAIARQLIEKSELNLISNFHYQPSFFWQHPNLESFYHLTANYLDVKERITTLNKRLDVLNEIHDVVLSYNETLHSSRMEIIIIVLIAIEIIFNVLNFHF